MNSSHPFLLRTLLVLLLLAGQSFYSFHEIESLSPAHNHSAECIVSFFEHNTHGSLTSSLHVVDMASFVATYDIDADILGSTLFLSHTIRAPPIFLSL